MADPEGVGPTIHRLLDADGTEAVYDASVEVAKQVLGGDTCHLVRIADEELEVLASANGSERERHALPVATDIVGRLDLIGRSHVFDDIRDVRSVAAAAPPAATDRYDPRSLLVVPVSAHGLLVATAAKPATFDDTDREWAEQLATFIDGILTTEREKPANTEYSRLERIATVLSHDFAGPLTVARGSLELAEETGEGHHFERAHQAIDRIEHLIEGIGRLAGAEDRFPRPELVELRRVVSEVWPAIDRRSARLEIASSRMILADEHALAQLLMNLLANAVDHGGDEVTVRVGVLEDGFYVEDDGPGIPPADRDKVFSWGYTTGEGSKGIGLSIVEQIALAHGWRVAVTEGERGGARFEITGVDGGDG